MNKLFVCKVDELADGEARKVETSLAIAVFNCNGAFFALADRCTHAEASMADGYIEADFTVECPIHSARFCLKSGKALSQPAIVDLATFKVLVEDGKLYVMAPS